MLILWAWDQMIRRGANGNATTAVYSEDDVRKDVTVTKVTQETHATTSTKNDDGTTTTTNTSSTTTNTITKNNETGTTSTEYGTTSTTTSSVTTDSDGNVVGKTDPTNYTSTTASDKNPAMKNLNAWTGYIANFNSSNDKTFNQTVAFQGGLAVNSAALAGSLLTVFISGPQTFFSIGGIIEELSDAVLTGPALSTVQAGAGAVATMEDAHSKDGRYVHSMSQWLIKDGSKQLIMQHNVLAK